MRSLKGVVADMARYMGPTASASNIFQKLMVIFGAVASLYSNPETIYSELMITAHKAECEMEEAKDKVRASSAVTTEVVDGSKELGNQIARLMANLTRAEQGNCPTSTQNSPRHRGHEREQMDRNTPTYPSSHNGQIGLGQTTSACSSSAASQVGTAS